MPDETTTEETESRELLELDVGEVSLVDSPAIRRKFVMVKREGKGEEKRSETEEADKAEVEEAGTNKTEDGVDENETIAAESEVAKQTFPMLTALANEKMAAVVERIGAIQEALQAGSLTKDQARDLFSGLSSLLWGAEDDVFAIAKSLGTPIESAEVSKARRMTRRRLDELKSARDSINSLLSELEEEVMAEEETNKTEVGEDTVKAITDAVTAAMTPVTERLDKIEAKVNKGAEDDPEKKVEKKDEVKIDTTGIAAAVEAAVNKAVEPITQRLDALEANPGTGGSDETETIEKKKDEVEVEKGSSEFWAGTGIGRIG